MIIPVHHMGYETPGVLTLSIANALRASNATHRLEISHPFARDMSLLRTQQPLLLEHEGRPDEESGAYGKHDADTGKRGKSRFNSQIQEQSHEDLRAVLWGLAGLTTFRHVCNVLPKPDRELRGRCGRLWRISKSASSVPALAKGPGNPGVNIDILVLY